MNLVSDWSIDVSSYDAKQANGSYAAMNWTAAHLLGGIGVAIIKSSEGTNWTDPAFAMQWQAAKNAGLVRVAYHFFRSNENAITQANYFKSILIKNGFIVGNDFIAADFETLDGKGGAFCLAAVSSFLYEVKKLIPASHMLIYTFPSFWQSIGGTGTAGIWATEYKLALAAWPKDLYIASIPLSLFNSATLEAFKAQINAGITLPPVLKPWRSPAIWQFTSRVNTNVIPGYVGVKKAVDYDAIYPSLLGGVIPTPPVPPTPTFPQYITTVNVNLRSSPADTAPVIKVLPAGTVVQVDATSGTRSHVISPTPEGWIYSAYLKPV